MDDFDLHIQNLLENRKDEIYEACMGENSFHKYKKLTFSYEKALSCQDENLTFNDINENDIRFSIADNYDINDLKIILNKYNYFDPIYLEPLHAQAIWTEDRKPLDSLDLDEWENHLVTDEEIKNNFEIQRNGFLLLQKEFSQFLLPFFEHDNNDLEITIKNNKTQKSVTLKDEILISIAKEYLKEGFIKRGFSMSFWTFDKAYKNHIKSTIQTLNLAGEKYSTKTLPQSRKDYVTFLAKSAVRENRFYDEEFTVENLRRYSMVDIKKEEIFKKKGRPAKYSVSTQLLIVRLSFLLRIEDFIIEDNCFHENIEKISLSNEQCAFIYDFLRVYNLIEKDDKKHSEGYQWVRNIFDKIKSKKETWYLKELERINSFIIQEAR